MSSEDERNYAPDCDDEGLLHVTRFYEHELPEKGECVMARIVRIEPMAAYAELLEYGNKEGMLLLSELSKRRFRSVTKLIKVGRTECVVVIRVDQEKGYIDLSKKRVTAEDIPACDERYSRAKKLQLTVRHAAHECNYSMEEINQHVIWPLYRQFGHAYVALQEALTDPERIFSFVDRTKVSQECLDAMMKDIQLRMTPPSMRFRAVLDISCSGSGGVEAVKSVIAKALQAVLSTANQEPEGEKCDISVRLIAPPRFIVSCTSHDRELGVSRLALVLNIAKEGIEQIPGGGYELIEDISVSGQDEEKKTSASESDDSSEYEGDGEEEEDEGMGIVE